MYQIIVKVCYKYFDSDTFSNLIYFDDASLFPKLEDERLVLPSMKLEDKVNLADVIHVMLPQKLFHYAKLDYPLYNQFFFNVDDRLYLCGTINVDDKIYENNSTKFLNKFENQADISAIDKYIIERVEL